MSENISRLHHPLLAAVLVVAFAARLVNVGTPLIDGMAVKQVYVAHKARQIAGPPFDPLNNRFDLLADDGTPERLTEEIPLYPTLLAAGYRLFGEREGLGRLLSSLLTVAATAGLYAVARRACGPDIALLSAVAFSFTPLVWFYGQAVQPDSGMLAGMLGCVAAYGRYLDTNRRRWWVAALLAGMVGACFKYYGLMVGLPVVAMAVAQRGRAGLPAAVALGGGMAVPVAAWMGLVFLRTPNPAQHVPYFLHQMPELVWQRALYERFLDRFLYKDCGPAVALLAVIGVVAAWRSAAAVVRAWTVMGVLFYFALGPLLRYHSYYELMLIPAAAVWAALGWRALFADRPRWGVAALGVLVAVQSPAVMTTHYDPEPGLLHAAAAAGRHCGPGEPFVIAGPECGMGVAHYARRPVWKWIGPPPADWADRLAAYRRHGARVAVVYFNCELLPADRAAYKPLLERYAVVERGEGPWDTKRRVVRYAVLDLTSEASGE